MYQRSLLRLNAWRWKCGLPDLKCLPGQTHDKFDYERLKETEWVPIFEEKMNSIRPNIESTEFKTLMRNRCILGAIRYGLMAKTEKDRAEKPKWDRMSSSIKRFNFYLKNKNQENLVDIANLCMLEYLEGRNPNRHTGYIVLIDYMSVIKSIECLLYTYNNTHNISLLPQIAKMCLIEFAYPTFNDAKFVAVDDGHHCKH